MSTTYPLDPANSYLLAFAVCLLRNFLSLHSAYLSMVCSQHLLFQTKKNRAFGITRRFRRNGHLLISSLQVMVNICTSINTFIRLCFFIQQGITLSLAFSNWKNCSKGLSSEETKKNRWIGCDLCVVTVVPCLVGNLIYHVYCVL